MNKIAAAQGINKLVLLLIVIGTIGTTYAGCEIKYGKAISEAGISCANACRGQYNDRQRCIDDCHNNNPCSFTPQSSYNSVPGVNSMERNQFIRKGDFLCSPNEKFKLTLQDDGNLCLNQAKDNNNGKRHIWCSMVHGYGADDKTTLELQGQGNLVVAKNGVLQWDTKTHKTGANLAVLQDDGNFVLYDYLQYARKEPKWSARSGNDKRREDYKAFDNNIASGSSLNFTFKDCRNTRPRSK